LTLESLTIVGKVSLILGDGATLTVGSLYSPGIQLTQGNTLTIYGQSGGTGALVATGGDNCAGIGGGSMTDAYMCGKLNIYGGNISATGGDWAAGIGSTDFVDSTGQIYVYGGTVTAVTVSDYHGGIGGYYGSNQGSLVVGANMAVTAGADVGSAVELTPDPNGAVTLGAQKYFHIESAGGLPLAQKSGTTTYTAYTDEVFNLSLASTISGGTQPYAFAHASGTLPAGLQFANGYTTITGTPTTSDIEEQTITMTVTDDADGNITATYTIKATTRTKTITYMDGETVLNYTPTNYTPGSSLNIYLPSSPTVSKEGYTFIGWYRNPEFSGGKVAWFSSSAETTNLTFYAKFSRNAPVSYSLYYYDYEESTGQTQLYLNPSSYTSDDLPLALPTPVKDGYTFVGWGESYASDATITTLPIGTTGYKAFYAKWTENTPEPPEPGEGDIEVSFVDGNGSPMVRLCTIVTADTTTFTNGGWYVVNADVAPSGTIAVEVAANLVLVDGKTLTVTGSSSSAGISVTNGCSLTIYGQSNGTGAIDATGGSFGAGIGGNCGSNSDHTVGACGTIVINGGTVNATGTNAAGIGGGTYGNGGTVTINRGTVNADGGNNSAGIGGGQHGSTGGTVTINGGAVHAEGGASGAGIGGGARCSGATVTINGGSVEAESGISGWAGIGSGRTWGDVEVTDGSLWVASTMIVKASTNLFETAYTDGDIREVNETTHLLVVDHEWHSFLIEEPVRTFSSILYYDENYDPLSNIEPSQYVEGVGVELTAVREKTGHTFDGWYSYDTNEKVTAVPADATGTYAVYAHFTPRTYNVRYFVNGVEDTSLSPKTYTYGVPFPAPSVTKAGYIYNGWCDNPELTGEPQVVIRDHIDDLDLYAKLTLQSFTITYYDDDYDTLSLSPSSYTVETETFNLPIPSKAGYVFENWYTNMYYYGDTVATLPKGSSGNKRFYSKWHEQGPETAEDVPYKAADGSGAVHDCKVLTSQMTELADDWYVLTNDVNYGTSGIVVSGDVKLILADGATLTVTGGSYKAGINVPSNSVLTIYAQTEGTGAIVAEGGSYSAGIGGNSGMSDPAEGTCGTVIINGGSITATGNSGAGIGGGYENVGGTVTINGGTIVAIGSGGGAGIGGSAYQDGGDVTINGGTVTAVGGAYSTAFAAGIGGGLFHASSGSLTIGSGLTVRSGDAEESMTVLATAPGSVTLDGKQYYSIVLAQHHTITYMDGATPILGLEPTDYIEGTSVPLPDDVDAAAGYRFEGWYLTPACDGDKVAAVSSEDSVDKVFYANWEPIEYTITYKDGDTDEELPAEALPELAPTAYTIAAATPLAETATKVGRSFDGWFDNADCLGSAIETIPAGTTGDKTFWAGFTPIVYSISYYDGETELEDLEPSSFTIEDAAKPLPSLENEEGRSFVGWCRHSDFSDESVLTLPAGSYGDATFYAKWVEGQYSIVYMDGSIPYSDVYPKTYTSGTPVKLPVPPAKDDAIFCGWFGNAGFEGDVVTEIPADATGKKTFYAKWEAMTGEASSTAFVGPDGTDMEEECAQVIPTVKEWTDGWYVVRGIFEINSSIKVSGNVNLVLADDSQLTISDSTYGTAGIMVPWGSSLTIYAQEKGNGELTATGKGTGAGIGGINSVDCGRVTINGGVVKVVGGGLGAGIGGANGSDGGDVIVNGGSLTAFGHPAIGAGEKLGGGTGDNHGTLLLGEDVTAHAAPRYDAETMVPARRTTLGTGGEIALDGSINYFEIVKGTRASPDTYLAFTSPLPFTIEVQEPRWLDVLEKGDIYYSTDAVNWTIWDGSHLESSIDGYLYALYFRGTDNEVISYPDEGVWNIDGYEVSCTGDVETLRDWRGNPPPMGDNCYMYMFAYCEALVTPPTLSATNLSMGCYDGMFLYCTALTTLPELPARELTEGCYNGMFMGTGICLYDTAPGTPWSIPADVTLPPSGKCGFLMFGDTGIGDYTDDYPVIGKTYYVKNPEDPDRLHVNPYLTQGSNMPRIYPVGTSMNYDLRLLLSGGVAPFSFETVAGTGEQYGLPEGLSLDNGVITGTVSGFLDAHELRLLVSDATDREVEMTVYLYSYSGSVTPLVQTTSVLGPVPAYVPIHDYAGGYEIYLTSPSYISGCIGGCNVFEKEDTLYPLPEGLLMDITGDGRLVAVDGMPEPGEYPFEVTARDFAGRSQDFMFTLNITTNREPILTGATPEANLVNLYTDEKKDFAVSVNDPEGRPLSYFWMLDGDSYDSNTNCISITPTAEQVAEKSIVVLKCSAWDGHYFTRVKSWTLNMCGWRHEITTDSLPSATVDEDYEVHLEGVGPGGAAEWYIADGDRLPSGLFLSVDGTISGAPRLSGSYTFRVVRMEGDLITSKEFTLVVGGVDGLPRTFDSLLDDYNLQLLVGETIPGDVIEFADGAEIATLDAGDFPGVTFRVPSGRTVRFVVDVEAPLDAQNLVVAEGASVVFEAVAARPYFGRYALVRMPETMAGAWSLETPFYLAGDASVDDGWLVFDALGGKDDLDETITVLFPDGPDARTHELTDFATTGGLVYRDESSIDGTSVLGSTLTLKGENSFGGAIEQIEGNTSIVLAPGASLRIGSSYALGGTLEFSAGSSLIFGAPAEGAVVSNAVCGGVIVPPASGTANLVLESALEDGDSLTVFDFYTGSVSPFVLVPPDSEDATHYSLVCEEGKLVVKCAAPVPDIGPGDMAMSSGDTYEIDKTLYFSDYNMFEVGSGTGPYTWSCPFATYAITRSANSFDGTSGAAELVLRQRLTWDINTIRLGFEFPFGGRLYNQVRVGMDGCVIPIELATEYGWIRVFGPDCPVFATADDIFVSRGEGSSTIRFGNYASVTLFADGTIRTAYGPLAGGVAPRYAPVDIEVADYGVSHTERVARFEPEGEVSGTLDDVVFTPTGSIPYGLSFVTNKTNSAKAGFSGSTRIAGSYPLELQCTDSLGHVMRTQVVVTVTGDTPYPKATAVSPLLSTDGTVHVLYGDSETFSIEGVAPENCQWYWGLQQVTNGVASYTLDTSTLPYPVLGERSKDDLHTKVLSCRVQDSSSHGFVVVASWQVIVNNRYYVDASVVDASPDGTEAHPFHTFTEYTVNAFAGDEFIVKPGKYKVPFVAPADWSVKLRSTGGAEVTMISVNASDKACFMQGGANGPGTTATVEGFTLVNAGGRAAYGGTLVNCVLRDSALSADGGIASDDFGYGGGAYGSRLVGCVVSGCSAVWGGGVASSELWNCTVVGNSASQLGGGMDGASVAYNTALWGNRAGTDGHESNASEKTPKPGYILPLLPETQNCIFEEDPLLYADGRPSAASPCLKAGNPELVPADVPGYAVDMAGDARSAQPTIGAYENAAESGLCRIVVESVGAGTVDRAPYFDAEPGQSVLFTFNGRPAAKVYTNGVLVAENVTIFSWDNVTSPGNLFVEFAPTDLYVDAADGAFGNNGLSWDSPFYEIGYAIAAAGDGDTIHVKPGVYSTILVTSLNPIKNLHIVSTDGPEVTVIDGNHISHCFDVGTDRPGIVLEGFTLQNGRATGRRGGGGAYGGTLVDCIVQNCESLGGYSTTVARGGGTYESTLINCVVRNCRAGKSVSEGSWYCDEAEGGGVWGGSAEKCEIYGNSCWGTTRSEGPGTYETILRDCYVYNNKIGTLQEREATIPAADAALNIAGDAIEIRVKTREPTQSERDDDTERIVVGDTRTYATEEEALAAKAGQKQLPDITTDVATRIASDKIDAYTSMFEIKTVQNTETGAWENRPELKDSVVEELREDLTDALSSLATNESLNELGTGVTEFTLADPKPGLYYAMEFSETLGGGASFSGPRYLSNGHSVKLTVEHHDSPSGFWRMSVYKTPTGD
jgi:uncharacterized repeat protein (TIGR02543 family)